MHRDDPLNRILFVDMTRKSHHVEHRPELFEEAIGGAGVAIRLLEELCPKGADPLGPENPLILAVGPLTSYYPLASKTVAMFKSPLTGDLGESHCGGRSAVAIRMAGYGAIVITGSSEIPLYLAIHGDRVHFRDASALWGTKHTETAARVIREREAGQGFRSIMRIGRAGERQLAFASVTTETYRHFGRLGMGAVMGSKKLKAINISGKRSLPMADFADYRKLYDEIHQGAVASKLMKKYHDLGTPANVKGLNEIGAFPTRNLSAGRCEGFEAITGEAYARGYLGRRLACAHCPVGCIHIAALREPHPEEPYFYKTSMISYDYELIYALGGQLGVADPEGLLLLLDAVEDLGLDAMSAGVALAWATEALERGLVPADELDGCVLSWGDWRVYLKGLEALVEGRTEFWRALGRGVDHAAGIYGGKDFALTFGGNEMPGYHTGPGSAVGHAVSARHSHLCNAGYSWDQKTFYDDPEAVTARSLADALMKEERWRQVLSSLVICFFARKLYSEELVQRSLASVGWTGDLHRVGEEIYRRKFRFKLREGFDFDELHLPRRIFETPAPMGPVNETLVREAIAHVRDWHVLGRTEG